MHTQVVYVGGEVEVEFTRRHEDVVRVHASQGVFTQGTLREALAVGGLQRDRAEEDHHHDVQTPHFVRLPQTVDPTHLPCERV